MRIIERFYFRLPSSPGGRTSSGDIRSVFLINESDYDVEITIEDTRFCKEERYFQS